jgi:pyrroloquinoline-quinone synthase
VTTTLAPLTEPWSPTEFEARLRAVGQERYHDRHPFNVRMHEGDLSPAEVRRWIANRFHYQRHIPVKDALITAKLDSPNLRRTWLRRIEDHDGRGEGEGGIERWLRLGEAAGLDRARMLTGDSVLPGVRLAVEGYVNFCRLRPPLEAVAASLTELTAPDLMSRRVDAFERHYSWIAPAGLEYFRARVEQGRRDSGEALALVLGWARTREEQERALAALSFKCDVLWALLDAVQQAGEQAPPDTADASHPEGRADAADGPDAEGRSARPSRTGRRTRTDRPAVDSRPWRNGRPERVGPPPLDGRPWRSIRRGQM